MSKEVQMTFRVEAELRADFSNAALLEDRPAAQVLREFMRSYVNHARARSHSDSVQKWTQGEAVAFECAREAITDMHAILTSQIVEETGKEQLDKQRLASLRAERSRLFQERATLHVKDHAKVARIRAEYGEMVRSWRAENQSMAVY